MAISIKGNNKVFQSPNRDSIGGFTLKEIDKKWQMIFTSDEKFIPNWDKKFDEHKASGFSYTFPYTDNRDSIETSCKEGLQQFINPAADFEINSKPLSEDEIEDFVTKFRNPEGKPIPKSLRDKAIKALLDSHRIKPMTIIEWDDIYKAFDEASKRALKKLPNK